MPLAPLRVGFSFVRLPRPPMASVHIAAVVGVAESSVPLIPGLITCSLNPSLSASVLKVCISADGLKDRYVVNRW